MLVANPQQKSSLRTKTAGEILLQSNEVKRTHQEYTNKFII